MYTIIIFVAAGILAGLVIGDGKSGKVGLATVFGMIAFITGIGAASKIGTTSFPTEKYVSENRPLHNLYDDTRLYGSFFLGSGKIEDVDYLFFNTITEDGIKPEKMEKYGNNVYILEDGDVDPRLELVCLRTISENNWGIENSMFDCKNVFHIPLGSVDSNFVVQ